MTLRPYQLAPVAHLAKRKRALVVAPAGSGKTVIAAAAICAVLMSTRRLKRVLVGWIANTQEQAQQARQALELFQDIKKRADVRIKCAAADSDWSDCDALIVDECHHAAAPGWRKQIETCPGARWGFTATPEAEGEDAEQRDAILEELFAPKSEWHYVDRADVGSQVSKAKVVLLDPKWEQGLAERIDAETEKTYHARLRGWGGDPQKLRAMVLWQKCVEIGIVANEYRNAAAQDVTLNHADKGESTLVLVNQVEHALEFATSVGGTACYSGMGAKARRHALYNFKTGKLKCLVATSLADEGLDVPRASVLVLVSGGKSRAKAEQRTGRVLRAFAGKEHGTIYDFVDSPHRLMAKHSLARQAVYRELGYEIDDGKLL